MKKKNNLPGEWAWGNYASKEGGTWYTDPLNFWSFRAIFHPGGLDFVPDRGGYREGGHTAERQEFLARVLGSAEFAAWVKEQDIDSCGVFYVVAGKLRFNATNNRSYGYTYLWAWEEE